MALDTWSHTSHTERDRSLLTLRNTLLWRMLKLGWRFTATLQGLAAFVLLNSFQNKHDPGSWFIRSCVHNYVASFPCFSFIGSFSLRWSSPPEAWAVILLIPHLAICYFPSPQSQDLNFLRMTEEVSRKVLNCTILVLSYRLEGPGPLGKD